MEKIAELAAMADEIEAAGADAGHWVEPPATGTGVERLPHVDYGAVATRLCEAAYRNEWVRCDFDWMAWAQTDRARALMEDPTALAEATPDELSRLLTVCVRSDRFCEGALLGHFKSGLIGRIARRAAAINEPRGAHDP